MFFFNEAQLFESHSRPAFSCCHFPFSIAVVCSGEGRGVPRLDTSQATNIQLHAVAQCDGCCLVVCIVCAGLYTVEKVWQAVGLSGFMVWKYALKRCADQPALPVLENDSDSLLSDGVVSYVDDNLLVSAPIITKCSSLTCRLVHFVKAPF